MEKSKKRIVVISLAIIVIIVVASLGFYLKKDDVSVEKMTAMEGLEYADEVATEWNSTSELVIVYQRSSDNLLNGLNDLWVYGYAAESLDNGSYSYCEIIVSIEGNVSQYTSFKNQSFLQRDNRVIQNWTIDSDEAIILANNSLGSRITNNYYPPLVSLSGNFSVNDNAYWYVYWYNRTEGDGLATIVQLDANTGEILSVNLDD